MTFFTWRDIDFLSVLAADGKNVAKLFQESEKDTCKSRFNTFKLMTSKDFQTCLRPGYILSRLLDCTMEAYMLLAGVGSMSIGDLSKSH